jgi:hypothetical protein
MLLYSVCVMGQMKVNARIFFLFFYDVQIKEFHLFYFCHLMNSCNDLILQYSMPIMAINYKITSSCLGIRSLMYRFVDVYFLTFSSN